MNIGGCLLIFYGVLLIPNGSIVFGVATGYNDQGKVFGRVNRLKIKGERIHELDGDLLSADESFGLNGIYYDESGKYLAGSLALNFLGSFAGGFRQRVITEFGAGLAEKSEGNLKNALLNALEETALGEAKRQAEKLRDVKPFVVIPNGTPAIIMVGSNVGI